MKQTVIMNLDKPDLINNYFFYGITLKRVFSVMFFSSNSFPCVLEIEEDEHLLACLLMVFIAVSIPKLARNDGSFYKAALEGHANNIHCMASAINNIFGALFTICGQGDIEDRMKEFLAVSIDCLNEAFRGEVPRTLKM